MRSYLDFEKPVAELEAKADELQASADKNDSRAMRDEAKKLTPETPADSPARQRLTRLAAQHRSAGRFGLS